MDISGKQKMRWSYLPHQQREALKFIWEHIDSGPIHYDGSMLFKPAKSSRDFESLSHVSKRTLKELVRHKLITISTPPLGAPPWEDNLRITLKPLGREWGSYPMNSQK